jgi:hypothetical protein
VSVWSTASDADLEVTALRNSAPGRFLTAQCRDLLMLNYAMDPALLLPLVPAGTTLDLWDGAAIASLVGFRFVDTRVLGIPVPWHRDFEEVNLRFYVRRVEGSEVSRGLRVARTRAVGRHGRAHSGFSEAACCGVRGGVHHGALLGLQAPA